jgi:L-lysine exporter family protein LysE/ArgO
MSGSPFITGFALCAALIVAIGAQNAFVLRQGLRGEHVLPIVVFCALSDLVLTGAGVAGLARAVGYRPGIQLVLTLVGSVFLAVYGVKALLRARQPEALVAAAGSGPVRLSRTMLEVAGFTFLNPHVYLDTVLLMGSIGARQPPAGQVGFVGGVACASAVWFTGLGFGARLLAPLFALPRAWQRLDLLVGATMLALAVLLLRQVLDG